MVVTVRPSLCQGVGRINYLPRPSIVLSCHNVRPYCSVVVWCGKVNI